MARFRRVLGTVLQPDGTPYPADTKIRIRLNASSFSTDTLFPLDELVVILSVPTGEIRGLTGTSDDAVGILLWCEDDGLVATNYTCTLPDNSSFSFNLAYGDGLPINLATLRAFGALVITAPSDPAYVVVQNMISTIAEDFTVEGYTSDTLILSDESENPDNAGQVLATLIRRLSVGDPSSLGGGAIGGGGSGGATLLDGLTDVTISGVTNGQVLKYDSGTSGWVNGTDL
ncbi:MAG: hypothetical protein M3Q33_06285, partial [Acidobacteriota bacterium]|nr:hypothetical protein [Acidobacteriota bacterium]